LKYTIYCIIQPGELEIQSLLLLSSLQKYLQGDCHLVACIPNSVNNDMRFQAGTYPLLEEMGVSLVKFENPLLKSGPKLCEGDLFSNKYFPLPYLPASEYIVFMDSDLLMISRMDLSAEIIEADFLAKPVCYMNESHWKELYGLFGLEIPSHRVRATVDQLEGPPYFNGGLFAIRSSLAGDLLNTWTETFNKISESKIMQDNLVNREQAALAISIARLNLSYHVLSERLNFPARSKQIPEDTPPVLIHYHDPASIYKNKSACRTARELLIAHPTLLEMASNLTNWKILTDQLVIGRQTLKRLKYRLKGYYQSRVIK
jgi:hypothetical protein